MKYGNTTDLTVGRYTGLEAYVCDKLGQESIELAIYNYDRESGPFSAKGDSGALVWCIMTADGTARIVGQLRSGCNKGGDAGNYVSYCTPGWWLLAQIRKRFTYAEFYRTAWSA